MRLAIIDTERQKSIREFIHEMEDAIEEYKNDEDQDKLINVVVQHRGIYTALSHLLLGYQTIFENACNKNIDYIDFRPDLKTFIETQTK